MALNFLRKNSQKFQIGLDIACNGITATLLDSKDKKIYLKNYAFEPFDYEVLQNGAIVDSESFKETVSRLFKKTNFDTEIVNISIPSTIALIKTITLPDLPPDEIKIIIQQEASKHIPFPVNDANIDYEILENTRRQEESAKKVDIVLAAVAKNIIKEYISVFASNGLSVAAVDVTPFAVIRTLSKADLIDNSDSLYVSVLIGDENTDINIIHKGMPLFSNNTPIGKKNIIDSLMSTMEISSTRAEDILQEIEFAIPGIEISSDSYTSKAVSVIRTVLNNISAEIQKTIEFYLSQNVENKEIKQIIVSGSGGCIKNIDKYLTSRLKIETVLCNALRNIEINQNFSENLSFNTPVLATSIGLALKGLES